MNRMMAALGLLLIVGAAQTANAAIDAPESKAEAKKTCLGFISTQQAKGVLMAFQEYWPLFHVSGAEVTAQREAVRSQLFGVQPMYAAPLRVELLRETPVGDSLLRFDFAEIFAHDIVLWRCTFFRPEQDWLLNAVEVSLDVDTAFGTDE